MIVGLPYFIPREYPGRLLRLDTELSLDGGEDGGEVGVAHPLGRPQQGVQHHVNLVEGDVGQAGPASTGPTSFLAQR